MGGRTIHSSKPFLSWALIADNGAVVLIACFFRLAGVMACLLLAACIDLLAVPDRPHDQVDVMQLVCADQN